MNNENGSNERSSDHENVNRFWSSYYKLKSQNDLLDERSMKIIESHAKVSAWLHLIPKVLGDSFTDEVIKDTMDYIWKRMKLSQKAEKINDSTKEFLKKFWRDYEYIDGKMFSLGSGSLNHSNSNTLIAISLKDFIQKCNQFGLNKYEFVDLKRNLKFSKSRKFREVKKVQSKQLKKPVSCWVFDAPVNRSGVHHD